MNQVLQKALQKTPENPDFFRRRDTRPNFAPGPGPARGPKYPHFRYFSRKFLEIFPPGARNFESGKNFALFGFSVFFEKNRSINTWLFLCQKSRENFGTELQKSVFTVLCPRKSPARARARTRPGPGISPGPDFWGFYTGNHEENWKIRKNQCKPLEFCMILRKIRGSGACF